MKQLLVILLFAATAQAAVLEGDLDGAPYRICVPDHWNGTLLVYAHGYRDRADRAGEKEDRSVNLAPSPAEAPQLPAMEDALLARGYALAASAFRRNGWAIEEGTADTIVLARRFNERFGRPKRTIALGVSLGALMVLEIAEMQPNLFDGAICACGPVAGSTLTWQSVLAFAQAYDAAFGWPKAWGTVRDVRDDLDFETEVVPVLLQQLQDPASLPKFEALRGAARLPFPGFYDGQAPSPWLFLVTYFATEGRAELEQRIGGAIGDSSYLKANFDPSGALRMPLLALHT
ncbi:MAG TPA: DUF6351 family protein, partial [Thermoanaerobaculia bacterium]|nr:DUF6351 family protein [Thermoanaerobaculia bacterium]